MANDIDGFDSFDIQTNRIITRLEQFCGGLTGEDLERELLRITNGKRYRVNTEFVHVGDDPYVDSFVKRIDSLLELYGDGSGNVSAVTEQLGDALTAYLWYLYPERHITRVVFRGRVHGWPDLDVVCKDIVEAARFCFQFTDGEVPSNYSFNQLMNNDVFWFTLVAEFNRNRSAAGCLGL